MPLGFQGLEHVSTEKVRVGGSGQILSLLL